jgi:hypothetical protein
MSIRDEPHFRIAPSELAAWLERQGVDRWWNVDGDPLLAGRLSFPCPADELAAELRRVNRPLLVQDRTEARAGRGQQITSHDLDALVTRLGDNVATQGTRLAWMNDRILFLCWQDFGDDWLLVEDAETTERSRQDAALAQGSK